MFKERPVSREQLYYLLAYASIDHDNSVCNTKGQITEEFNKDFGTNHKVIEIVRWNSVADWALDLGYSQTEASAINHRLWYNEFLINQAKPNPGAIEFLEKVKRIGNPLINSSRPYEQLQGTVDWYKKYAPFWDTERIVVGLPDIVRAGDLMAQAVSKAWIVKLFKCRSHIEDVTLHAKLILDTTDAFVFFLSDDPSLDEAYKGRIMRFGGVNGAHPDLTGLNSLI